LQAEDADDPIARVRDSAEVVGEVLDKERVARDPSWAAELKVLVVDARARGVDVAVPAVAGKLEV
jgi:hypothetical protein